MQNGLPTLNVSLLEDLFRWIENKNGDEYLWNQGAWITTVDEEDRARYRETVQRFEAIKSEWSDEALAEHEASRSNVNPSLAEVVVEKNFCGTALCAAGWAGISTGTVQKHGAYSMFPEKVMNTEGMEITLYGDEATKWNQTGQYLFGFTRHEAETFFSGGNRLEDLRKYAQAAAARRGLELMI